MRILLAILAVLIGAAAALAETRAALVVGNGAYAMRGLALANPPQDARAVATMLQGLGFSTETLIDADRSSMEDALARLVRKARDADIVLFYFAGHGLQDSGRNFLMPVDARLDDETDLRRRFVRLDDLLEDLSATRAARIIVLDACRDNAAVEQLRAALPKSRAAGVTRGLAAVPRSAGMLVAFATQPNRVAADGDTGNSPFTRALVDHLATPGVELRTALTRVRVDVARATADTQVPEVADSLLGEIYLRGGPAGAPPPPAPVQPPPTAQAAAPPSPARAAEPADWEKENALWNAAQGIGSREAYQAYLEAYPKGHFAAIAQAAIGAKRASAAPPAQIASATPAAPPVDTRAVMMEGQARAFVERLNADWSRDNAAALSRAAGAYGRSVVFNGKPIGREQLMEDKRKFVERWPVRRYQPRPDSIRVRCSAETRSCTIAGIVDYAASNPASGRRAGGVTSFEYELSFAEGLPQIVAEAGQVLQRN